MRKDSKYFGGYQVVMVLITFIASTLPGALAMGDGTDEARLLVGLGTSVAMLLAFVFSLAMSDLRF